MALAALAALAAGCATTTYTNPAKGDDPTAMKSALDKCDKAAETACSPTSDGYRQCLQRKVAECMQAEGWTAK